MCLKRLSQSVKGGNHDPLAFKVYLTLLVAGVSFAWGEMYRGYMQDIHAVSLLHPRSIAFHCVYERQRLYFYRADTANRSLSEN